MKRKKLLTKNKFEMSGGDIRKLRKDFGLNQGEFAQRIGVSSAYLSQVETGKYSPSIGLVVKIRRVFFLDESERLNKDIKFQKINKEKEDEIRAIYSQLAMMPFEKVQKVKKVVLVMMAQ